ncbi:histone-lysine N-methyltransferase, H3 lysine-79 specific-like isoform X2 [Siniperca chuatsi]|uniref:histone-lysine N-methyltransferase, H3 lysine-79 specific-like isoform X2 n=1 Tax=Siniperca chuatsi TaxID=119488 RepID=UPI001CE0A890|nr:histone-lysine N-methyltransferase, H3 lysine-79 specific-like isoform X2 [Siniperca chuatsi]
MQNQIYFSSPHGLFFKINILLLVYRISFQSTSMALQTDTMNCTDFSPSDIPISSADPVFFSSSCTPAALVCGFVVLIVCGLIICAVVCKWKRGKTKSKNEITLLQNESQKTEKELREVVSTLKTELERQRDQLKGNLEEVETEREKNKRELQSVEKKKELREVVSTLTKVKTELERQRDQLKGNLEEVKTEREKNKRELQSVEMEITEGEIRFDKPEELLKKKEKLLQDQWKLDEKKKNYEREKLNIEKLLKQIENQVTRFCLD